ncbi:beta family protein [Photobacterium chitinilyticum]|uniref:beta family protein n=1 Tax=Photobacterium chitinilyticum TaxID=2485123 RepID=UPI003D12D021
MSIHHYYPRLKWKPAEWEALQTLPTNILEGLTPILFIPDIDWDYENDCYKKSLASYLSNFGTTLAASWPLGRPVLLDVGYLDLHGTITSHPLDLCIQDALQFGKTLVPVYSPYYSPNYLAAVQRNLHNGVALKLKITDLIQAVYSIPNIVTNLNITTNFIDLIIDLEDIQAATFQLQQQAIQVCNTLLSQAQWRNVILSSTCYPSSQAGIPQHQVHLHPREEWRLWSSIIQSQPWIKTPSFSDYPTSSSQVTSINPRFMSQYVSIRYSTYTDWVFVKGVAARGNGWGQTQQLCDILVNSQHFMGPNFCWGDEYIDERAKNINRSGGSKEWRKVAHSHHLTLVVQQLFNYSQQYPAVY